MQIKLKKLTAYDTYILLTIAYNLMKINIVTLNY